MKIIKILNTSISILYGMCCMVYCEDNVFLKVDNNSIKYDRNEYEKIIHSAESRVSKKIIDISKFDIPKIAAKFDLQVVSTTRDLGGNVDGSQGARLDYAGNILSAGWNLKTATQSNLKECLLEMHVGQKPDTAIFDSYYRLLSQPVRSKSPRIHVDNNGPGEVAIESWPWPYFFCRGNIAMTMFVQTNEIGGPERISADFGFDFPGLMKELDAELQKCPIREYDDFFRNFPKILISKDKAKIIGENIAIPYELSSPLGLKYRIQGSMLWLQDKLVGQYDVVQRPITVDTSNILISTRALYSEKNATPEELKESGVFFIGIQDKETMMSRIERIQYPERK